jgi:chromate transporter
VQALRRHAAPLAVEPITLTALFLAFLKIGAVVFGSGYVLLAFFRTDLVDRLHWLTEVQLLDAVAAGQITPGPTFASATFIGYLLAGLPGSIVATIAVFLPSFLLAVLSGPLLGKLRNSTAVAAVLDGLNAGSIALMAAVCYQLGRAAVGDWFGVVLMFASAALVWKRVNPAWAILLGAFAGYIRG